MRRLIIISDGINWNMHCQNELNNGNLTAIQFITFHCTYTMTAAISTAIAVPSVINGIIAA